MTYESSQQKVIIKLIYVDIDSEVWNKVILGPRL